MTEGAPARKEEIIGALVLAFECSPAGSAIESAALRSALFVPYGALFEGNALVLDSVLALLEGRSGFNPEMAQPALCRIKTWERALEVEVRLPANLADLDEAALKRGAARCAVPPEQLSLLLGKAGRSGRRTGRMPRETARVPPPRRKGRSAERGRRAAAAVLLAGMALAAFFVAGVLLVRGLSTSPSFESLPAHLGEIPAGELKRRGREAGATLTDESWLSEPPEAQRQQMSAALESLAPHGVDVLFVRDPAGRIRATAQWDQSPAGSRIVVKFR